MKQISAILSCIIILAGLLALSGCDMRQESKNKATIPAGASADTGTPAVAGKKGSPPMPGP